MAVHVLLSVLYPEHAWSSISGRLGAATTRSSARAYLAARSTSSFSPI
jgi:hypothetical protein